MAEGALAKWWNAVHVDLGIPADLGCLDELIAVWGGPGRFYHSLAHLRRGLSTLDGHGPEVSLVRLAWFFHDAIYVTGRSDNEDRSAAWFVGYTGHQGLHPSLIARGEQLIVNTKDHQGAICDDLLWPIMNDVDLAVFAARRDIYDE